MNPNIATDKGVLIVFEGPDGAYKETNSKRLLNYIRNDLGRQCMLLAFPTYESSSSDVVKYLKKELGELENVDPRTVSQFYANDRFEACKKYDIQGFLDRGVDVIFDRYVGSNLLYQSVRYNTDEEKDDYIKWNMDLEFEHNKLPVPDITLYMRNDITVSLENREDKKGVKNDVFESNKSHIQKVKDGSQYIIDKLGWNVIQCNDGDKILSEDEIFSKILKVIFK